MELKLATVRRLGERARGTGLPAGWARSRLLRAGDRGEPLAIYEVWDLWLAAPDGELWAALDRWRTPRTTHGWTLVALGLDAKVADVIAAASLAGHPLAAIARARILAGHQDLVDAACEAAMTDTGLADFCREHQLVPADPHRAAVYFLVTGQDEQYRLVDPDHSLLAVVYQGAGEDERSRVRTHVAGDPELVRVLADTVRRGGMSRLTERESEYLADAFAGRRDWPGLWALVKDLPVDHAAAATRRFDGWRPDGPDGPLFDALAAVDLAELAASHRAVARPEPTHLPVRGTNGGSISPDGRRIVVASSSAVDVFTLADDGEPRHVEHLTTSHRCEVLALNDAVLVNYWGRHGEASGFTDTGYVPDDTPAGIHRVTRASAFDRTANGFAALVRDTAKHARTLRLGSGSGPDLPQYERRDLDLRAGLGLPPTTANAIRTMAVDPGSGLVAFAGQGLFLARITGSGLEPLAHTPFRGGLNPVLAFSGPDRLIGLDDQRTLRVWRPGGDELHLVAERTISGANPVDLPVAGVIAMQDMTHKEKGRRQLRYVDGETLVDVSPRDRFNRPEDTYGVFASPDGTRLGVCYWDGVDIVDVGFTELSHRPLAATTLVDLYAVRARLAREPGEQVYLDLLRTCLEHRFATDVALGSGMPAGVRDDDIGLGGTA